MTACTPSQCGSKCVRPAWRCCLRLICNADPTPLQVFVHTSLLLASLALLASCLSPEIVFWIQFGFPICENSPPFTLFPITTCILQQSNDCSAVTNVNNVAARALMWI